MKMIDIRRAVPKQARVIMSVASMAFVGLASLSLANAADRPDPDGGSEKGALKTIWAQQGWPDDERKLWHSFSAGQALAPLSWMQSLRRADRSPLLDPAYLTQLGFIIEGKNRFNPNGLPVGFAVAPPSSSVAGFVGMTCSACHTGQIRYKGTQLRIDGGSSNANLPAFISEYYTTLFATFRDPLKWDRFSKRVAQLDGTDTKVLRAAVERVLSEAQWSAKASLAAPGEDVTAGPGRADAFDRIGNFLLGERLRVETNFHKGSAPASYPPLWDIWKFNWVHYNASFSQPMARNILQVLGNSGHTNFISESGSIMPEPERWKTSIDFKAAAALEDGFRKLRAPVWPEALFGPVDRSLAAAGKALFEKNCSACHAPRPIAAPGNSKALLAVTTVPVQIIGTDPVHAELFANRTYDLSKFLDSTKRETGANGLTFLTNRIKQFGYDQLRLNEAQRSEMDGFGRDNLIRGLPIYKARTLDGVWSTGPYLHNGSVPNIYELLSPAGERSSTFWVGGYDFDPVKLGFVAKKTKDNSFLFDTRLPGNRNTGHEFSDTKRAGVIGPGLSHEERMAIIEYLKILPEMPPKPQSAIDYATSMTGNGN